MESQKHLFNLRRGSHYLNCAYKAPLLRAAEEAAIAALVRGRNPADIGRDAFFDDAQQVRAYFGKIINAQAENIAIVPSASYGFASVLNNIAPKKGGNALVVEGEFPSGYFAMHRWCAENNNTLDTVKAPQTLLQGEDWNAEILRKITSDTSVVLLSSVHWMHGLRFALQKIGAKCKQVGAKFIVDGSQSVGALPIDVEKCNIDALVCVSYKWLLGAYSVCLLYLNDTFANGKPLEEAWINRLNSDDFTTLTHYQTDYRPHAARYNMGEFSNFILLPMLKASLQQILNWEITQIQAYCKQLIAPMRSYLDSKNIAFEPEEYFSNHLFSLRLSAITDLKPFKTQLLAHKIYVSYREKHLRISVNVFNDTTDIAKLLDIIPAYL